MTKKQTANWAGKEFHVCDPYTSWSAKPGVYIFAGTKIDQKGISRWTNLYTGQCRSFADRLPNHEKWPAAKRLGATHIHARIVESQAERDTLEEKIIQTYQPPLNDQHK